MKYFLVLILIGIVLGVFIDVFLLSDEVFYFHLTEKYSNTRIEKMLDFRGKWLWVTYFISPAVTFFKILLLASLIYLGLYLSNLKYSFSDVFKACVIAEFVLLLPILIKIIWFEWIDPSFTLEDFKSFYPLSMFSLFDPELLEKWFHYPFKALNVFEIGYWFALAGSLSVVLHLGFKEMLKVVVCQS
ncbi:hypothetical protein MM236_07325 [Belliella sp. DSM 107340]|uniref:DUF1772 domain-containing protein n=1 Tax=Belliella calami TaxID=2923436 RepID=A0ABS9UMD9_9BACT|nr:hypothetical protein [Belliella calami]MCH7397792.1 hypothetical protein [Belliella calami]